MHLNVSKDKRFLEVKRLLGELERDYNLDKKEILDISGGIRIPLSLFETGLSSFEIIVKYLIEEKKEGISAVARLTNRSKQGVWQAYEHAKVKHSGKIKAEHSPFDFPVSIIWDEKFSVLESIVRFLKDEHGLSYSKIAGMIARDQRTVWTVYDRARGKSKRK